MEDVSPGMRVAERPGDPRHQPHRPQIDVLVEFTPPRYQRTPQRDVIRHLGGPADRAEEDRVVAADLLLPILRHHAAVFFEVLDAGEIEPVELELEPMLPGGLLKGAYAFGRDFLADAVARYDGDAIPFLHVGPSTRQP